MGPRTGHGVLHLNYLSRFVNSQRTQTICLRYCDLGVHQTLQGIIHFLRKSRANMVPSLPLTEMVTGVLVSHATGIIQHLDRVKSL